MLKRQLYLQILSNLLIPILGYVWWNWNLYFILLFFMLDMLTAEIVHYLKVRKIKTHQQVQVELIAAPTRTYAFISLLFLLLTLLTINFGMLLYQPTLVIKQEIWLFLSYKEWGIPQGIILIPLVALMAFMQFKTEFVLPKIYLTQREKPLWKNHLKERFLLLSFCCILLFVAAGYEISEWIVLTIIIVATTMYTYLQGMERIKKPASNH